MKPWMGFTLGALLGIGMTALVVKGVARAEAGCRETPEEPSPCCNGDTNGDGGIDVRDVVYLLHYIFRRGAPAPVPIECPPVDGLPATGLTRCFDNGGAEIPCDDPEYPGQDAYYQLGCPAENRFVDNGDGTLTDTCSGLMWQQDTADVNGDGAITGADTLTWQQALQYCETLEFSGRDDWRLPNIRELHSIVDQGRWGPAIDPAFNALPAWYWSSTTHTHLPDGPWHAWYVGFASGNANDDAKGNLEYVRAVRTVQPGE